MPNPIRRVVTGHDKDGKAVVISDGPAPFVHVNPTDPDWYSTDIWRTDETPARIVAARGGDRRSGRAGSCRRNAARVLRVNHFPPETEAVRRMTPEDSQRAFAALGNAARPRPSARAGGTR